MAKSISLIDFSDGVAVLSEYGAARKRGAPSRRVLRPLPAGADLAAQALEAAEQAALAGLGSRASALCLGADHCLLRDFALPFTARAKVAQAVDFELQSGLPVPAAQLHGTTYATHPAGGGTRVFSFSLRREAFAGMLRGVRESGLEPRFVGLDLACAAHGAEDLPPAPGRRLLLEVGFTRTLLVTVEQGKVIGLRRVEVGCDLALGGGHEAREALFGAPMQLDAGTLRPLVEALARELTREELLTGGAPDDVALCGPGAGLAGLPAELREAGGLPAATLERALHEAQAGTHAGARDGLVAAGLLRHMDAGWLRAAADGNLRKDDFTFVDRSEALLRHGVWAASLAALLLAGWGAADMARGVTDVRSAALAEERAGALFKQTLPEVAGNFGQTQMVSILRSRIDQMSGQAKGSEPPAKGALDILRHVSEQAKGAGVVVDSLSLGPERGSIAGTSKDYAGVNGLRDELASGGLLGDVRIVVAAASKNDQRVRFDIQFARK